MEYCSSPSLPSHSLENDLGRRRGGGGGGGGAYNDRYSVIMVPSQ